jgi:membrane fusion protein (multidrug efflux system)
VTTRRRCSHLCEKKTVQLLQPNPSTAWRVFRQVALLGLCTTLAACNRTPQAPAQPPPMEVSVIKVTQAPVTVLDEFVAQTQAPKTIEIRSQVTGLLERQAYSDGAFVSKGQLLYVIDQRPFRTALAQAQANLAQAQANLQNTRQTLRRYQELVGQGFVSKQAYETAVAQERAATAGVAAQRAQVNDARINLGYAEIRAPADGYVSESRVNPGALVTAQQTLLNTLYSSDPMYVNFTVSEERMLEVQGKLRGSQAPGARIVLADGTQYPYPGTLDFVDAAVDQKTGTLQVRVRIPNPDRTLRPNMFVRVVLPSPTQATGMRVPQQAVTELQGNKMVYVVGPDGKAQARQIAAELRSGNDWIVEKGLSQGELVIVEGVQKVQMQPNAAVKPVLLARAPGEEAPATNTPTSSPPPLQASPPKGPAASAPQAASRNPSGGGPGQGARASPGDASPPASAERPQAGSTGSGG